MRSAWFALLLVFPLAAPARGGCGPSDSKTRLEQEAAEVKAALEALKKELVATEEAYRQRVKALEQELVRHREARNKAVAEKEEKLKHLAQLLAELEARLAKEKAPKAPSVEEKLDLILKKLDDLDKRVRKLEEKATRRDASAERDFNMAEFYRRSGYPDSASFYYQLVRRRYPGTPFSTRAAERVRELDEGR